MLGHGVVDVYSGQTMGDGGAVDEVPPKHVLGEPFPCDFTAVTHFLT